MFEYLGLGILGVVYLLRDMGGVDVVILRVYKLRR